MMAELLISHILTRIEQLDACLVGHGWKRSNDIEIDYYVEDKYRATLTIPTPSEEEDNG